MIEYSEEQLLAIQAPKGVTRIMAGPGSGKTAVITARIQHLIEHEFIVPSEILSVSFTVKAVEELRQRLMTQLGEQGALVEIKTIHALCLSIYIDHLLSTGQALTFAIQEAPDSVSQALQATLNHFSKDPSFPEEWLYPKAILTIVRQLKQNDPESLLHDHDRHDVQLVQYFDRQLQKSGLLTFDDLGPVALKALRHNPQLLQERQHRHRAIFVDEAQDLNAAQFAIIKALGGKSPCLTLVGDDDQCIYAWRGAIPEHLKDLDHHYPNTLTYTLGINYRCPQSIVTASSGLIANNSYRFHKELCAVDIETESSLISVHHDHDAAGELKRVGDHIERLIQSGVQAEQIAVLNRHNSRSKQLQMALLARKLPVVFDNPLLTAGGQRVLGLLYVLYEGIQSPHFGRIIDLGVKRLGKSMLRTLFPDPPSPEEVGPFLSTWTTKNPKHPLSLLLGPLFEKIKWASTQPAKSLPQTWQQLCASLEIPSQATGLNHEDELAMAYQSIHDLCTRHAHSLVPLPSVLAEAEANKLGGPRHQRGIHVLSLHRAKGLEFDHVFIMGVQPGILPTGKSMFNAQRLEEERRLFYVGMTRSRQNLYLSHYGAQLPILSQLDWGGFLDELPSETLHHIGHIPESQRAHV